MAVETGTSSEKAEKKKIALYILTSNEKGFIPCIPDSINYELNEYGAPGKLTFKVMKDKILDFEEGACVQFSYGDKKLFRGYVFSRKQDKNGIVSVTAYDQLRYLKNKDIYAFAGVTASQILKQIADDFKLQLGDVDDTKYVIPKMRASNETLFDIIQKALDHTYLFSKNESGEFEKKRYILFDDFGKICLKEVGALDVPILVDSETAENFSFESSIDKDTYNKVKLYEDNKDTGKREVYIAEFNGNNRVVKQGSDTDPLVFLNNGEENARLDSTSTIESLISAMEDISQSDAASVSRVSLTDVDNGEKDIYALEMKRNRMIAGNEGYYSSIVRLINSDSVSKNEMIPYARKSLGLYSANQRAINKMDSALTRTRDKFNRIKKEFDSKMYGVSE